MEVGDASSFTQLGTIGIEEEFFIVDESGNPVSGTDELVYETEPPALLKDRLDHELFKFVIETQTPIIERPGDAADILADVRSALVDHAADRGYRIAAAGLHPTASWRDHEHAEKPRYRSQLDRIQYPQHRNTTAGLHVHVGVDDPEKAVWIANEIRWRLPVVLALSVNSPFWCGIDTGLHSARAKIFEALPNTGMPTRFDSYDAFDRYEHRMVTTGSIADRGEIWFDVRPHSELGTVEVRTPDAQADQDRVLALVEYIHASVMELATRYEDGGDPTSMRRELLDENKWRAMRHGHGASFLPPGDGDPVSLAAIVDDEADRLEIDGIRRLFEAESGADRLRRIRREEGDDAARQTIMLE